MPLNGYSLIAEPSLIQSPDTLSNFGSEFLSYSLTLKVSSNSLPKTL